MVVVAIVGLLAAVAIPKYADLLEKANLGATLGNLASLRSAVSIYYGTFMAHPETIDPETQPKMKEVLNGELPFVKAKHPQDWSPYGNEVTVATVAGAIPSTTGTGWFYVNADGALYVNSTAKDIKNYNYTMY